jgi:hypothetical protein
MVETTEEPTPTESEFTAETPQAQLFEIAKGLQKSKIRTEKKISKVEARLIELSKEKNKLAKELKRIQDEDKERSK